MTSVSKLAGGRKLHKPAHLQPEAVDARPPGVSHLYNETQADRFLLPRVGNGAAACAGGRIGLAAGEAEALSQLADCRGALVLQSRVVAGHESEANQGEEEEECGGHGSEERHCNFLSGDEYGRSASYRELGDVENHHKE